MGACRLFLLAFSFLKRVRFLPASPLPSLLFPLLQLLLMKRIFSIFYQIISFPKEQLLLCFWRSSGRSALLCLSLDSLARFPPDLSSKFCPHNLLLRKLFCGLLYALSPESIDFPSLQWNGREDTVKNMNLAFDTGSLLFLLFFFLLFVFICLFAPSSRCVCSHWLTSPSEEPWRRAPP